MEPTRKESRKCTLPDIVRLAIVARKFRNSLFLELTRPECTAMLEHKKQKSNHAKVAAS